MMKEDKALAHLAEAQAKGLVIATEMHGSKMPSALSAGIEAAQETILMILLFHTVTDRLAWSFTQGARIYLAYLLGLFVWKMAKSAWHGWSQLENLHRLLEEERWEIEHNRSQEREELKVIYAAKGFEGKLLEDVVDVLMADEDRLLQVMVEEEFKLPLGVYDHPLKQGLGAGLGVAAAGFLLLLGFWIWPWGGIYLMAFLTLFITSYLSAYYEKNRLIPAVVWNIAIVFLAVGCAQFFLQFLVL